MFCKSGISRFTDIFNEFTFQEYLYSDLVQFNAVAHSLYLNQRAATLIAALPPMARARVSG